VILEQELHEPPGAWLEEIGVERCDLTGAQVSAVEELAARYRRPSRLDLFALVLARDKGATLLTDEGSLRAVAEDQGVVVEGVLWILDLMVKHGQVTRCEAATSLRQMIAGGRRLPDEEVKNRLRMWEVRCDEG
jgi:predicted nucleic acid-binding protein